MQLSDNLRPRLFKLLNALLGVVCIVELLVPRWLSWIDAAAIALAAAASLVALNRQLPLQNIFTAAIVTAALGSAVASGASPNCLRRAR